MPGLNEFSFPSLEFDTQFVNEVATGSQPPEGQLFRVVSHFPRYADSVAALPASERQKIEKIARFVAHCLRSGKDSVRTIRLIGHADLDTPRRPAFEHQVARARAQKVLDALSQAIDRVERENKRALPPYSSRVAWEVQSLGATRLVVPNPRTEIDRSRNRRVEISLLAHEPLNPPALRVAGTRLSITQ